MLNIHLALMIEKKPRPLGDTVFHEIIDSHFFRILRTKQGRAGTTILIPLANILRMIE